MDYFTIISYPGARDDSLLSLTEGRSRYMIPFGGRFRVVDFTVRNSAASHAQSTIIYSNVVDGLSDYTKRYTAGGGRFPSIRVVAQKFSDINFCYRLIMDTNTPYYIIYNGDSPSVIDFSRIIERFKKKKADSALFLLNVDGKASMAYKMLVTKQKTLLKVIKKAIDDKLHSPNIFEMVINVIINSGIKKEKFDALYWPLRNIPEYYEASREVIYNREIASLLFEQNLLEGKIHREGFSFIGENAEIASSFITDNCHIDGRIENSIIYPGAEIGARSVIKDSIVLPFARIAPGARITRAIVDEKTNFPVPDENGDVEDYFNVGSYANIGSDAVSLKNSDYPKALFSGITLVGRDSRIPERSNIGGACYVAPGKGEEYFSTKKYLYDGMSVKE